MLPSAGTGRCCASYSPQESACFSRSFFWDADSGKHVPARWCRTQFSSAFLMVMGTLCKCIVDGAKHMFQCILLKVFLTPVAIACIAAVLRKMICLDALGALPVISHQGFKDSDNIDAMHCRLCQGENVLNQGGQWWFQGQ